MIRILFTISIFIVLHTATAQPDNGITLPVEINTKFKDIDTKITFLKILINETGSYTDVIVGFQNPLTKEWIYFKAENVPFSLEHGFTESFELKLADEFDKVDVDFTWRILERKEGRSFLWKCGCNESIPELPF